MIRLIKYRKKLIAIVAVIAVSVFMVNAESNYFNLNYSEISDDIIIQAKSKMDIESFDISYYFEHKEIGNASWYGKKFHNRKTASGERFNMHALTAAHKNLPLGAIVRVTNEATNETALLKINDRGPYVKKRIIDLSFSAAQKLSATTNPTVKIETLLAQNNSLLIPDNDKYLFGYSYDLPLVCIPSKIVALIDSTDNFETAIKEYELTKEKNNGKFVYLFTDAGKIEYKYNNLKETYYIGLVVLPQNSEEIIVKK